MVAIKYATRDCGLKKVPPSLELETVPTPRHDTPLSVSET